MTEIKVVNNRSVSRNFPLAFRYVVVTAQTADGRRVEAVGRSRLSENRALENAVANAEKLAENGPNVSFAIARFVDGNCLIEFTDSGGGRHIEYSTSSRGTQFPKVKMELVMTNDGEVRVEGTGKLYLDFRRIVPSQENKGTYDVTMDALNDARERAKKLY